MAEREDAKWVAERYTALWRRYGRVKDVAREAGTTTTKARKILITLGIYTNAQHQKILSLVRHGMRTKALMRVTKLGPRELDSYFPFHSGPFSTIGWVLEPPCRRHRPIIASDGQKDVQPWLEDRTETLIQAFCSLALDIDLYHPDLIDQVLPLASQYAPILQSLVREVVGPVSEEPMLLDYGHLTLVDVMVANHLGHWLAKPWQGGAPIGIPSRRGAALHLYADSRDIRPLLEHDLACLSVALRALARFFALYPDQDADRLMECASANLGAMISYIHPSGCSGRLSP